MKQKVFFIIFKGLSLKPKSKIVVQKCSAKKMFLKISQNSQENNCTRCFPLNSAKVLIAPFLKEQLWWLRIFLEDESPALTAYIHGNTALNEYYICDQAKSTKIQEEKSP